MRTVKARSYGVRNSGPTLITLPWGNHCLLQFLTALTLLVHSFPAIAGQNFRVPSQPRVGFSARVFPGVDQRDVKIAMELWTRELAHSMGIKAAVQTNIYKNSSDLLEAVKRGELILVTLPALEYLRIRDRAPMTPLIVSVSNAGNGRHFVLVARRDSGIRSLAHLRGKTISLLSSSKYEVSHLWLNVMLMREGFRGREAFFRQTKESTSASQALMAVFFKQADAAIISRAALETTTALNPQMGRQLGVVSESKSLLGDVSCVPNMVEEPLKRTIENAALHLHETTVGKQMFTLFQIDRTIPYIPAYLDGVTELLRERNALMAKQTKRR